MIEWLLRYLKKMTDEQKRELAKAFFTPSAILFKRMEQENITVRVVDEFIQALEKMNKEEEEQKKREQEAEAQAERLKKVLRPGESVAQYYNRMFREMGCKDPFPEAGVFEQSQSASSLQGEGDG